MEEKSDSLIYTDLKGKKLWDAMGLHRPIASFWYMWVPALAIAIPGVFLYSYVIPNFILPYPNALGFNSLTVNLFALFFTIMDASTGPACERFVAEYAEIDPHKAMRYTSFFIWFQMVTGLIQVTAVTFYCFIYVVNSDLGYAMWFFLFYSLTQYPGMLGSYKSTLKGFQRFDRASLIDTIQGALFENFTMMVFILLGRWWGRFNPAIGELMGATIGFIIGKYLDDFFAMGLSIYFLKQILEPYGISIKETIQPIFTKEEVKKSLSYGVKLLGAPLISTFTENITLFAMIAWVPNYISILGYIEIARSISGIVGTRYNFTANLAQAYNNGKKKLAQYTIARSVQHWWFFAFFLTLEVIMVFPSALQLLGGEWGRAAWIIPIYVAPRLLVTPAVMGAEVVQACDRPLFRTWGIVSEKVTKMLTVLLLLSPWGLVSLIGSEYYITLFVLHDIPAYIVITLVEFGLAHRYIYPIKINWYQTLVAGTLCSVPFIPLNLIVTSIIKGMIANPPSIVVQLSVVIGMLIILLLFVPTLLFFFYGFFGGWDDAGLQEMEYAVELSGPTKFLFGFYVKVTQKGHQLSLLKNKFRTPHEDAYVELRELMELKKQTTEIQ